MKSDSIGQKVATFKNTESGEIMERIFNSGVINPPSKPVQALVKGGITNSEGLVDVNPYTLQHKRYENIFAFGDCTSVNTTRTQTAAARQCPIVKHNVQNFLEGKELNAIYDGYSYLPFYLGHSYSTSFSHLHNYEPTRTNHMVPHYGIFANLHFKRLISKMQKKSEKYASFNKNAGPPYWSFNPRYVPLEHNEYLQKAGVNLKEVRMFEPKVRVTHDDHHHDEKHAVSHAH